MDDLETQWMQLKVRDLERNTCLITINFTLVNILHTNLQRFKFPGHKRAKFPDYERAEFPGYVNKFKILFSFSRTKQLLVKMISMNHCMRINI